ncbi:MAG TPA: hypothetical protein VGG19_04515 [Tepidisphaeraceae bacterium]
MTLEYAIERLYQTGWQPTEEADLNSLADGRKFPSVEAIKRQFEEAGLQLSIKHHAKFNCYRAGWIGAGAQPGTVIGACEREAAVYALAQLRQMLAMSV